MFFIFSVSYASMSLLRFPIICKIFYANYTLSSVRHAVEKKMIGELSGARILEQLKLICLEVDPWLSFRRLEELKVFQGINSNIVIDKNLKLLISQVCKFKKIGFSKKENGWVLVLIALLKPWKVDILKVILDHLNPSRRIRKAIEDMPRWKTVEKAIKTGEIKTPAEFFHRVRAISEITILFVSLTNNDKQQYQ